MPVTRFAHLQIRRDTAANWTSADTVLKAGEFAYETDTQQMKVGDGATAWSALAYVTYPAPGAHNSLTGLQGGTTAEYYHLTSTQHGRLSTVSAFGATLIDDADAPAARTTLGLGTMATQSSGSVSITGGSITGITLAIAAGGTGATTASDARTALGLAIGSDVQAYNAGLLSIAGLTTAADKMIYTTSADTYAVTDLSAFARTLLDDADAAAMRTTLGAAASSHVSDLNNPHATTLELARTANATFAGNVAMGGNLITGHGSPATGTDVVNKDYVDNLFDGRKYKAPVDLATTGNIVLSGEQTIDGTLTSASRVLVWQQTNAVENGIYTTGSGAWTRTSDANTGSELVGLITNALGGTTYADREFYCTDNTLTIDVDNVTIVLRATVTNHNNLAGLQGGTTAEYYHLTNTQHSAITTTINNLTTQYRMTYVNSAGTLTESTSIVTTATGQLAIGGAPVGSEKLYVNGTIYNVGGMTSASSNDITGILYQVKTSASTGLGYFGVEGSTPGSQITGSLAYATFISSGAAGTALQLGTAGSVAATITSGGNVGIGTSSPSNFGAGSQMLTVAGTTTFGGIVCASNTIQGQMWAYEGNYVAFGSRTNHSLVMTINNTEVSRWTTAGALCIGTTTAGASKLVVADDSIQINTSKTPATAGATGTTGQVAWDANYVYVCTATNTWKRAALSTW